VRMDVLEPAGGRKVAGQNPAAPTNGKPRGTPPEAVCWWTSRVT
jgi:hypothetical protein